MSLSEDTNSDIVEHRVSDILRDLGFGAHESAVVIALNQRVSATVSDLHNSTGIHHANLYSVLDGLIAKGIVISNEGRPREYQFAPLRHLEDLLYSKVTQLIEDLKKIQEERTSQGAIPALIYTIRGSTDVQTKIISMINRAETRILLVSPTLETLGNQTLEALGEAVEKGVLIRAILGEETEHPSFEVEQRLKDDTLAINLVTDGKEAMISMPDLSVCGWADNALIALQFEGFLEQTWNQARII